MHCAAHPPLQTVTWRKPAVAQQRKRDWADKLPQDLLRFTESNDPDYEALREARTAVEKVADHLEVSIKLHEASMAILDLQRSMLGLDFQLISPGRRLIKFGVLVKEGRRSDEERAFFLFTDMLLYADVQYGWTRAISGFHAAGSENHVYTPSVASDRSRMSVLIPGNGLFGSPSSNVTLTYKRKMDLIDVSVVGSEGSAFEIFSSVKSFTVVARELADILLGNRQWLMFEFY